MSQSNKSVIRPRHAIAFADLFALLFLLLVLLPHNPAKMTDATLLPPGSVIVEVRWDDNLNVDIDTWVKAPGQVPVGYSNPHGPVFNLLRDDLGHRNDPLHLNYENAYSRGAPNGDYVVNLHYFAGEEKDVTVTVRVWIKKKGKRPKLIGVRKVTMLATGHEVTVMRFSIVDSALVSGSVHEIPTSLIGKGG
jgi:hypothetical protein